jgi:hypothetical protein
MLRWFLEDFCFSVQRGEHKILYLEINSQSRLAEDDLKCSFNESFQYKEDL